MEATVSQYPSVIDLDRDPRMLVAVGPCSASAATAPDPHFHPIFISEVAPPALAPGRPDFHGHPVPVLAGADRERVAPTAPTPRDRDQRARPRLNNRCSDELSTALTSGLAVRFNTANGA